MIFDEQESRKPDHYPWAKQFKQAMHKGHWTSDEFNFQADIQDFKTGLSEVEKQIVVNTLSAIGQIEIAVKKFWAKLGDNLPHPSLQDLGYVMANIEVIHNDAYEKLLSVLYLEDVFEENLKLDIIQGRVKYLKKYNHKYYKDSKKQYIYSLILFTLFVENVSLFSQFYVILWFNRFKNVLKDSAQQIQYTKNEETIHAQVGIKLVNVIREEYPELFDKELEERIYSEVQCAYDAEAKIIDWILGSYDEEYLNADILKEYVKKRLNDSLIQIYYTPVFTLDNNLVTQTEWMNEEIFGNAMTDFFFKRPTEYQKGGKSFSEDDLF